MESRFSLHLWPTFVSTAAAWELFVYDFRQAIYFKKILNRSCIHLTSRFMISINTVSDLGGSEYDVESRWQENEPTRGRVPIAGSAEMLEQQRWIASALPQKVMATIADLLDVKSILSLLCCVVDFRLHDTKEPQTPNILLVEYGIRSTDHHHHLFCALHNFARLSTSYTIDDRPAIQLCDG